MLGNFLQVYSMEHFYLKLCIADDAEFMRLYSTFFSHGPAKQGQRQSFLVGLEGEICARIILNRDPPTN